MLPFIIIIASIIVADRLVKYWAMTVLSPVTELPGINGIFHFYYEENNGAAFSFLSGQQWFLIITSSIVVAVSLYFLFFRRLKPSYMFCISMIAAGGIGNLIDRIIYGYVVDMFTFDFVTFAIFNVADIFITLGGIGLIIVMLFFDKERNPFNSSEKKDKVVEQDTVQADDNRKV